MKTTHDILVAARARIAKPENWCQFVMAKDHRGKSINSRDPMACCWCAGGAIYAVSDGVSDLTNGAFKALEMEIAGRHDGNLVPHFNDSHSHTKVLELFDRAIATAA